VIIFELVSVHTVGQEHKFSACASAVLLCIDFEFVTTWILSS